MKNVAAHWDEFDMEAERQSRALKTARSTDGRENQAGRLHRRDVGKALQEYYGPQEFTNLFK